MRYAGFRYGGGNLGDEIQSLAAEQHLPRVDELIEVDTMRSLEVDEPTVVIFQGWFAQSPETCFPPAPGIVPVFVGFHITRDFGAARWLLAGESLEYLRRHQPIGCRDDGTRQMLEEAGVSAYRSLCLTLTLPPRDRPPADGRVFIVDAGDVHIPRRIREGAVRQTHAARPGSTDAEKREQARHLLDAYRTRARLVVTTKLHCALPCLAMGIPVVFFGDPDDYRFDLLGAIGQPIHPIRPTRGPAAALWRFAAFRKRWRRRAWRDVDWDPPQLDVSAHQRELRSLIERKVREAAAAAAALEASAIERP